MAKFRAISLGDGYCSVKAWTPDPFSSDEDPAARAILVRWDPRIQPGYPAACVQELNGERTMVAPDSITTGEQLAEWRHALGWSQPQAAETLRLPVATYRQYEQGRRPLPAVVGLAAELLHAAFVRRA